MAPPVAAASPGEPTSLPRVLVLDLTPVGHLSATGQIKATLFRRWPNDSVACVIPNGAGWAFIAGKGSGSAQVFSQRAALRRAIEGFAPAIVYIRPVPQAIELVTLARTLQRQVGFAVIVHVMDDDLSHLESGGAPGEYGRLRRLSAEIWCMAQVRLAISESLGRLWAHTFGGDFHVLGNCVSAAHWPVPAKTTRPSTPALVRYAGGFSDKKESASIIDLAEAVESLGGQAVLEVSVGPIWRRVAEARLSGLQHVRVVGADPDEARYRDNLRAADILVAAYNFDSTSLLYLRYSFGNKLPEMFSTGKPVLVYGSDKILNIRYALAVPGVRVVCRRDIRMLGTSLTEILDDYPRALSQAAATRTYALDHFNAEKILPQFESFFVQAAELPRAMVARNTLSSIISTASGGAALLEHRYPPSPTMQHAIREDSTPPLFVIGNGPSLRGFDFSWFGDAHTIGMNAAYRYWDEIGWYPTYYACLDTVVGLSHQVEIERLARNASEYGIRGFLLRHNLIEESEVLSRSDLVHDFDQIRKGSRVLGGKHVTTGSHACRYGVYLGYTRVYLLGIDCSYVERVAGSEDTNARAEEHSKNALEMKDTPVFNPNYFFNSYQREGDRYNVPNVNPELPTHLNGWRETEIDLAHSGAVVLNANLLSKVDAFDFIRTEDALRGAIDPIPKTYILGQEPVYPAHMKHGSAVENICGPFDRTQHASFDEIGFILDTFFPDKAKGIMLDAGAHFGSSAAPFAEQGWRVIAFEPDQDNREKLTNLAQRQPGITVDNRAVARVPGKQLTLYASDESTGVSTLVPFLASHHPCGQVTTTSVAEAMSRYELPDIDFLKIDVEGFGMDVLQGVPWEKVRPSVIMVEFEDNKTRPLGYGTQDTIDFLRRRGYVVLVSEWHPVIKYGQKRDWAKLYVAPCQHPPQGARGNLIAVHQGQQFFELRTAASRHIQAALKES